MASMDKAKHSQGVIAVIDPYSTTPPQTIVPPNPRFPDDPNATVRRGDILNIQGAGEGVNPVGPRRIVAVQDRGIGPDPSGKPARLYLIQLDQPVGDDVNNKAPNWLRPHTAQYVIYRQPRPMAGEPVLQLPRDVGIDFSRVDPDIDPYERLIAALRETHEATVTAPFDTELTPPPST